jgi:hypothetical protein
MDYNLEDEKKSKDDVIIFKYKELPKLSSDLDLFILWKKIYVMLRIYL